MLGKERTNVTLREQAFALPAMPARRGRRNSGLCLKACYGIIIFAGDYSSVG
jgi:hypothetical protein